MKKSGKQKWLAGDEFVVPLENGSFGLGKVLAAEPEAMNSVICAFFDRQLEAVPEDKSAVAVDAKIISVLWVTRDLLDSGVWKVFGNSSPPNLKDYYADIDERRARGFVGTKIYGSGIIKRFLDAFFLISPWDVFAEPGYLDKLLLDQSMRPAQVIFSKAS